MYDPNWCAAMNYKMQALRSNDTWDLIPQLVNANIVGFCWLCRHKFDSQGHLDRYKGHLVAHDFSQQPSLDFDDTFSSFVKPSTIQTIPTISISRNWPIRQLDVKNAFIHDGLVETIYMHQPPEYVSN